MNFCRKSIIQPLLFGLGSGILISLGAPHGVHSIFIWVAMIPIFFLLEKQPNLKPIIVLAFSACVSFTILSFHWIELALRGFFELSGLESKLFFLLSIPVIQPQFLIAIPLTHIMAKKFPGICNTIERIGFSHSSLLILLYPLTEFMIPKIFNDGLGHALYSNLSLVASVWGLGQAPLTALILLGNFAIYQTLKLIIQRISENKTSLNLKKFVPAFGFVLIFISLSIIGANRRLKESANILTKMPPFPVALIQGNISNVMKSELSKNEEEARSLVLEHYIKLSEEALNKDPNIRRMFWPETTYPSNFRNPQTAAEANLDDRLTKWLLKNKLALGFGGYDMEDGESYNAVYFAEPINGEIKVHTHRKNLLMPLGERWISSSLMELLHWDFKNYDKFSAGLPLQAFALESQIFESGPLFKPVICYEILFPEFLLSDEIFNAHKGRRIILNFTNDSWFLSDQQKALHLAMAAFTSAQTQSAQIRITNSGTSALISPHGEILKKSKNDQVEIIIFDLNDLFVQ
jgi:apolipoprotein N-acyltransferase